MIMDLNKKYSLDQEHKEMGKDVISVIISYTPISGIIDTAKFFHKWIFKKKGVDRIAHKVRRHNRRFKLKFRNNRIEDMRPYARSGSR
jgi:hypothetical protein